MIVYFISIITIGLYLWLSYLAFRKWKQGTAIQRFSVLLLLVMIWMTVLTAESYVSENKIGTVQFSNLLAKIDFFIAALIAYFIVSFAFHFPRKNPDLTIKKELILFLPIFVAAVLSFLNVFFSEFKVYNSPEEYYPAYWFYISLLSVYFLGLAFGTLLYKLKRAKGVIRLQLKYITISYGVSIVLLLFLSMVNAVQNINDRLDIWLSNTSLIFITGTAYAVLKHRLFGLRYFIRKTLISSITFFLLFFLYTYFVIWLTGRYGEQLGSSTTQTLTTVLVIVLSYPILRRWIRKMMNTLFAPSEAARRERLMGKVLQTAEHLSYANLFPQLEKEIKKRIAVSGIRGAVLEVSGDYFEQYPQKQLSNVLFTRPHSLVRLLKEGERILVRDEIPFLLEDQPKDRQGEYNEAKTLLEKLNASVAVLFGSSDVGPVVVLLPEKNDKSAYGSEEIEFLKQLSLEASGAFENIFLYQQALKRAGVPIQ